MSIGYNNTMVIGGYSSAFGYIAKTFVYNHNINTWSNGPVLNEARAKSAAGIIVDEVTFEELVVVTGGQGLKSIEILDGDKWSMGRKKSH